MYEISNKCDMEQVGMCVWMCACVHVCMHVACMLVRVYAHGNGCICTTKHVYSHDYSNTLSMHAYMNECNNVRFT